MQSVYDKHSGAEFQSEIRTLAQVEHLNLVKLHGYLEFEDERIVIVEYVPNGTLREHLDCEFFLSVSALLYVCVRIPAGYVCSYLKYEKHNCRSAGQHS